MNPAWVREMIGKIRVQRAAGLLVALGKVIWAWRIACNLSQEGLGNLVGLHRTYISEIERGSSESKAVWMWNWTKN
jgi:hypothetical protein